ncbi:MAG: AMP-binding protein, partial [Acidobacteriota bacterium]
MTAGNIVGLAVPNGPAFAAAYLGLRRAGLRVLLMDRGTPLSERRRIERSLACAGCLFSDTGWPSSAEELHLSLDPTTTPPDIPDAVTTIRLTSGSTGQPRGIGMTSEALLNDDAALRSTMGLVQERALAAIPLSHAYGFSSLFLPALTRGWLLAIPDGISPFAAVEAASASRITFLPTVPAYIEALLKMEAPPPLPTTLRKVITAGAPLKPETARRFREIFGQPIHVFYGASEVGGICYDRQGGAGERGTLGTPVEGVKVLLAAEPSLDDGQGIVEVLSPAAAVGYIPNGDDTLGRGRYLTSDIGSFREGELQLLGRVDAIVNGKGKKVDPQEIETVLNGLNG